MGILTKEAAELEVASWGWRNSSCNKARGRKKRSWWKSPALKPSLTSLCSVGPPPLPKLFFCLIPLFYSNVDHKSGFSGIFAFVGKPLCPRVSSLGPRPIFSAGSPARSTALALRASQMSWGLGGGTRRGQGGGRGGRKWGRPEGRLERSHNCQPLCFFWQRKTDQGTNVV